MMTTAQRDGCPDPANKDPDFKEKRNLAIPFALYSYSILLSLLCLKCSCFYLLPGPLGHTPKPSPTHIKHPMSHYSHCPVPGHFAPWVSIPHICQSFSPKATKRRQGTPPTHISLHVPSVSDVFESISISFCSLNPPAAACLLGQLKYLRTSLTPYASLYSNIVTFYNSGVEFIFPVLWIKRQVQRNPVQLESDLP